MAFPNDDPTVQQGDRSIQLIDWLVGREDREWHFLMMIPQFSRVTVQYN
jgi:hypothetical protein